MSIFARLSRRRFIVLTGATAAHAALYAAPTLPTPARAGAQSLAGKWRSRSTARTAALKKAGSRASCPTLPASLCPGFFSRRAMATRSPPRHSLSQRCRASSAARQEHSTGKHLGRPLQTPRPGAIQAGPSLRVLRRHWQAAGL